MFHFSLLLHHRRTDRGAPNYCLLSIDLNSPHYTNWTTLIGEHDRNVLEWAACVSKDRLVTCYMVDVKNALKVQYMNVGVHFRVYFGGLTPARLYSVYYA